MFQLNNKNYLCVIDYHSKFLIVKKMEELSPDNLISAFKVGFSEYGTPKRIMSDAGGNFISEKFKYFCNSLNIEQPVSSSYHHQTGGGLHQIYNMHHEEVFESGSGIHIALLQIRSTPLGQGLPSLATLPFNCPVRGIMPIIDRPPINTDNDDKHHTVLVNRQYRN